MMYLIFSLGFSVVVNIVLAIEYRRLIKRTTQIVDETKEHLLSFKRAERAARRAYDSAPMRYEVRDNRREHCFSVWAVYITPTLPEVWAVLASRRYKPGDSETRKAARLWCDYIVNRLTE